MASALSGLTIAPPTDLSVNNTPTTYSASATAAGGAALFGTGESLTSATFTFPLNLDLSAATFSITGPSGTSPSVSGDQDPDPQVVRLDISGAAGENGGLLTAGASRTFTVNVNDVVNPSVPGSYTWTVSMEGNDTVSGNRAGTFVANTTAPSVGPVSVSDDQEWLSATTTVSVGVGPRGRLGSTAAPSGTTTPNSIFVTFPVGYSLPASATASSVTIDGAPLSSAPEIAGQTVTLRVPAGVLVPNDGTATVAFLPSFGIDNPDAGDYTIQARTDAETTDGTSATYTIAATPTTLTATSANQPAAAYAVRNEVRPAAGFLLQRNQSSSTVHVAGLTVESTEASPSASVSEVSIYRDNGDGAYGAADTLLNTTPGTFSGSAAAIGFDSSEEVTTTARQYWIVYGFAFGAEDGASINAALASIDHDADSLSNQTAAGNTFTVDASSPAVTITSPAADGTVLFGDIPPVTLSGTASDTVSGVDEVRVGIQRASDSWWWNGIGWQAAETSTTASTTNGWTTWSYMWGFTPSIQDGDETYSIEAVATDVAGLTGDSLRESVGIDNVRPSLVSASAPDPAHVDVVFSERLDEASVDVSDFFIAGLTVTDASLRPGGTTVRLATDLHDPGVTYTVSADPDLLTDEAGNPNTSPSEADFEGAGARIRIASAEQPDGVAVAVGETVAVDAFTMEKTAGSYAAQVASITVQNIGDATEQDVSGVSVYRDTDDNGVFDEFADALLNSDEATFTADMATVDLDAPESVAGAQRYFVVYDISPTAEDGRTASSRVVSVGSDATVTENVTVAGESFTLDSDDPGVFITAPATDGEILWGPIPPYTMLGTATDTASVVETVSVSVQRASDSNWWNGLGWQADETSVTPVTSDGWSTWEYLWGFTPALQSAEETFTVRAVAFDSVGHSATAQRGEIRIDNLGPTLTGAAPVDPTHVELTFSEPLSASSVEPSDFSIAGLSVMGVDVRGDGSIVRLATDVQQPGTAYTASITLSSVTDAPGNPNVAPNEAAFEGEGAAVRLASAGGPERDWATAGDTVSIGSFTIQRTSGTASATVSAITIENTGTAGASDIDAVHVYGDTDGDGSFDPASDAPLNSTAATFSGTTAAVDFDAPESVSATATTYFVAYTFSSSAAHGRTAFASIDEVDTDAVVLENDTTTAGPVTIDIEEPTAPVLGAAALTATSVETSWTASDDPDSGVSHYMLRRADGALVEKTANTSYSVTGLTAETEYRFFVEAVDFAGNITPSEIVTVVTLAPAVQGTAPHIVETRDTDVCAMCHRAHTSASGIIAEDARTGTRRNALIVGNGEESEGDKTLCFACHGVDMLGSSRDAQTEFSGVGGHRLTPDGSEYGPANKQCSTCHDSHGTKRTAEGATFPALLSVMGPDMTYYNSGEEVCGACHLPRQENLFPGLELWSKTAHSAIPTATGGTGIVCTASCHGPHQTPIAPSIRTQLTPPSVESTSEVTGNDRTLCYSCHGQPQNTWDGSASYQASVHGSSEETLPLEGEWVSLAAGELEDTSRRVGECQTCHAAMGAPDGEGDVIDRLAKAEGQQLCLRCHVSGGYAGTDLGSLSYSAADSPSIVAALGGTSETRAFGRVQVFSRESSATAQIVGPREFVREGGVGRVASGDIDGDGTNEVLVARPNGSEVAILEPSPFSGLAEKTGGDRALPGATFLAIGDVLDDVYGLPEVVSADDETVYVYRWNGAGFVPIDAYSLPDPATQRISGLAVGKVIVGSRENVVLTVEQDAAPDSLIVFEESAGSLSVDGSYATRLAPRGPSIGDLDGDGLGEIAVANFGETDPVLSVFSGAGTEIAAAGTSMDASATATLIADVMPGLTQSGTSGAEVTLALADPSGAARAEIFPQSSTGLDSPLIHDFSDRSNPSALAAGDVDGDGKEELVVGLGGRFSRTGINAVAPGVAILNSSAGGDTVGTVSVRSGGGLESAGGTAVTIADLGGIGPSRHPVGAAPDDHISTEAAADGSKIEQHVECADCHNVHASTDATATAPAVAGVLAGTWGVGVNNIDIDEVELTEKRGVEYEYELCMKCHSAWSKPNGRRSIAAEFNTNATSFHPVEAPAPATNATGDTLVNRETGSYVYCTDCHGNSSATEANGPHRSFAAPLLRSPATGVRSEDEDALCYRCHRYDVYATGVADGTPESSSGFYEDDLGASGGLHSSHTNAGFACSSCHVSHGSPDLPALLRDDIGWDAVAGGGACTNGCHIDGERNEYTR